MTHPSSQHFVDPIANINRNELIGKDHNRNFLQIYLCTGRKTDLLPERNRLHTLLICHKNNVCYKMVRQRQHNQLLQQQQHHRRNQSTSRSVELEAI